MVGAALMEHQKLQKKQGCRTQMSVGLAAVLWLEAPRRLQPHCQRH